MSRAGVAPYLACWRCARCLRALLTLAWSSCCAEAALFHPLGSTSVLCARAELRVELVSMLLAAGADANEADEKGDRPMHLVSCTCNGELCDDDGEELPYNSTELCVLQRLAGTNTTSACPMRRGQHCH